MDYDRLAAKSKPEIAPPPEPDVVQLDPKLKARMNDLDEKLKKMKDQRVVEAHNRGYLNYVLGDC